METLEGAYQLAWDIPTKDMIEVYAIIQKFTGQAISADLYVKYDSNNRQVGTKQMLQDFLLMRKYGMKSRYYINSRTRAELEVQYEEAVADCDSCSL